MTGRAAQAQPNLGPHPGRHPAGPDRVRGRPRRRADAQHAQPAQPGLAPGEQAERRAHAEQRERGQGHDAPPAPRCRARPGTAATGSSAPAANDTNENTAAPQRRAQLVRIQAQLLARQRVEPAHRVRDHRLGEMLGVVLRQAARLVDQRQLRRPLRRDTGSARRAPARSGTRTSRAASAPRRTRPRPSRTRPRAARPRPRARSRRFGARARHAQDQAGVRHQPVVHAEHGRAQVAAARQPAMPCAPVRPRGRGADARVHPAGRATARAPSSRRAPCASTAARTGG